MCYIPICIFDLLYSVRISSLLSFLFMPILHIFLVISISWVIKVCIMGIIALKLTYSSFHSVFKRLSLKSDFFFFFYEVTTNSTRCLLVATESISIIPQDLHCYAEKFCIGRPSQGIKIESLFRVITLSN